MISMYTDCLEYLFHRMVKSAKNDPYCSSHALFGVRPEGNYELHNFPGDPYANEETISELQLEWFLRQQEWPIIWDPCQLDILCSARWPYLSKEISDVRAHVSFWVTGQANDVKDYLDKKLNLTKRFLDCDLLYPEPRDCILTALQTAIHEGGEVIALLSEHEYYGSGHQPWIRHRFKKLVLIEAWLTKIFKLLIRYRVSYLAEPKIMSGFCDRAQSHNARTLHAWTKALRACIKDHSQLSALETDIILPGGGSNTVRSNEIETQDADKEWETEDTASETSDWETEEEWEEGHMLETAVERDRRDAKNPQLSDPGRHTCCKEMNDYDEEYWRHVYPRIIGSRMDQASPGHSKSRLRRLARYARDFVTSFF